MIQIASLVTEFGKKGPTVRNIMTLKSCAPITGAGAPPRRPLAVRALARAALTGRRAPAALQR